MDNASATYRVRKLQKCIMFTYLYRSAILIQNLWLWLHRFMVLWK